MLKCPFKLIIVEPKTSSGSNIVTVRSCLPPRGCRTPQALLFCVGGPQMSGSGGFIWFQPKKKKSVPSLLIFEPIKDLGEEWFQFPPFSGPSSKWQFIAWLVLLCPRLAFHSHQVPGEEAQKTLIWVPRTMFLLVWHHVFIATNTIQTRTQVFPGNPQWSQICI